MEKPISTPLARVDDVKFSQPANDYGESDLPVDQSTNRRGLVTTHAPPPFLAQRSISRAQALLVYPSAAKPARSLDAGLERRRGVAKDETASRRGDRLLYIG